MRFTLGLPEDSEQRQRLLKSLAARDGWHCVWCSRRLGVKSATLEHLLPRGHGGSDSEINLVLACRPCNQERGDTPALEWAQQCRDRGLMVRSKLISKRMRLLTDPRDHRLRKSGPSKPLRVRRPDRKTRMQRAFEAAQENT